MAMMMVKSSVAVFGFAILGLASACSVDATSGPEDVESSSEALCANQDGTNAWMAAVAAATGNEIGRLLPARDFQWNAKARRLELTSYGKKRCDDGKCFNVQELLNMQNPAANQQVVFPGGDRLNTDALTSRLEANWNRQMTCNGRPDNGKGDDCPREYHELNLTKVAKGACDQVFTFKATATDFKSTLKEPGQLKNMLVFLGYDSNPGASNPYLAFSSTASTISIDPTLGLTEGGQTSSGACVAACAFINSDSMTGSCCSCNGVNKKFSRSPWSSATYLCK